MRAFVCHSVDFCLTRIEGAMRPVIFIRNLRGVVCGRNPTRSNFLGCSSVFYGSFPVRVWFRTYRDPACVKSVTVCTVLVCEKLIRSAWKKSGKQPFAPDSAVVRFCLLLSASETPIHSRFCTRHRRADLTNNKPAVRKGPPEYRTDDGPKRSCQKICLAFTSVLVGRRFRRKVSNFRGISV